MKISVIGLGKLGLPLAGVLAEAGHEVIGVDLNEELIDNLNQERVPIQEPGLEKLINANRQNLSYVYSVQAAARETQVSFIIVPTPSDAYGMFTSEYVTHAVSQVGKGINGKPGHHLVVVVSTVMPGASEFEIIPALEAAADRKLGQNLDFCYSPAFIALGSVIKNMKNPDFYLIGESSPTAGYMLTIIARSYTNKRTPITCLDIINAEIAKLTLNTYITMKISFANQLAEICEKIPGADASEIAEAIGQDERVGVKYLKPATAYGGPCFPRDSFAFYQAAKALGVEAELATATQQINDRQVPRLVSLINRIADLDDHICILGLAYKDGTSCIEEAVGAKLYDSIKAIGYEVYAHDPMIEGLSAEKAIEFSDIIVITTPAKEFKTLDYGDKIVIDCWGISNAKNVIRIGKG